MKTYESLRSERFALIDERDAFPRSGQEIAAYTERIRALWDEMTCAPLANPATRKTNLHVQDQARCR